MTPEDIGWHQAVAAWVSAVAAIVQAIGSIAAIFYAIRIAKRASEQAKAEVAAAVEREREAQAASVAREAAASRRSAIRDENERRRIYNSSIESILAATNPISREFAQAEDDFSINEALNPEGHYSHEFSIETLRSVTNDLDNLKARVDNEIADIVVEILIAIRRPPNIAGNSSGLLKELRVRSEPLERCRSRLYSMKGNIIPIEF